MRTRNSIRYLLVLGLALVLAVAYVVHRDLHGRYQAYQRSEESVQAAQHKEQALEDEKQRLEQRVKDLDQNPLEVEAAIRRIKRLVRDGETVYRLEEAPETAAPAQE